MTPVAVLQARAWAIVAAVADGRRQDVAPLLEDLSGHDVAMLVTVMAEVMVEGHVGADPARLAALARITREHLLLLAARERPADDDG